MQAVEIQYRATKSGKWRDHDFIQLHYEPSYEMYREIHQYMHDNCSHATESAYRFNEKHHLIYFVNSSGEHFKVDLTPLGIFQKNR